MANQASTSKSKTPLADSDVMKEIKKLHIDMVIRLSKHFTPSLKEPWEELLTRLSLFLEPAELNQDSFIKICDKLMNKEIIDYGKYDELYEVIHQINVRSAKIIQETSERIHDLQAQGPSDAKKPRTGEDNSPRTEEDNQKTEIAPGLRPMIETTKAMILKEDKEYNFFQTKSFQVTKEKLLKNGLVIIKGNSGDGKTSMALELLRLLCCGGVDGQQRQPLELHDIPDFKSVAPKLQLVIYVDDIFGKNVVCERDVDEWEKKEESILSKFCGKEHRDGNFLVITVRNGILNSLKGSLPKVFTKENIVNINLDKQEKLELLRLYSPKDNFDSWKSREEKAIIKFAPDLGFPQCCRLFRDTLTLHTERVQFFKRPFDFLKSSLFKLKDGKFSCLMYLFLKGGKVREDDLDAHGDNIDQAVLEAAFAIDVVKVTQSEPPYKMPNKRRIEFVKESLDCLLGWLVKKKSSYGKNVCYKFNHDSIGETVALLYGEKTPIGFIENCPRNYLSYVTTSKTAPNQILISSDNQKNAMYKRLVREFESEYQGNWFVWITNFLTVSLYVWTDDKFFKGFIRWLNVQDGDKNLCHDIKLALLNKACDSGSEDHALFLLSQGVEPDVDTALNVVRRGCLNVLKQIVKHLSNEIKPGLLNEACSSGSEDCALFLLAEGVEPDVDTAFYVVKRGCVNVLKQIYKDISNEIKPGLLNEACSSGSEDCVLFLLAEGVEPDECTGYHVVQRGFVNVLKQIYKYISNEIKHRLLNVACASGSEDCALFLLAEGVEPGNNTLVSVVQRGCVNVLKQIYKYISNEIKPRLLNEACSYGSEDCVLFLLAEGVIPDLETLFSVLQGGCVNVLGKLLEYDIYTTARADESQSSLLFCSIYVLHEAILSQRKKMVFMLFDRYPHLVHDTDELGQSLLHLVTQSRECYLFQRVERMMLNSLCRVEDEQHKCEVVNSRVVHRHCACAQYICQLVDHRGHTVLHTSCSWGNTDVCKYLCESYPALTTVVNNKGETVLHSSCHWGWRHTIKYKRKSFTALTAFVCNDRETEFYTDFNDCESFSVNNASFKVRSISSYRGGNTDVRKYLFELFPTLTTVVNYNVETMQHYSCKAGDSDIVKYLCESFPALTAVVSNDGRHCLHYIAESRFSNVDMFIECETRVKQYLESTGREYDITTIRDSEGNSVLDLAKKGARYRKEEEFKRKFGDFGRELGYQWRVFIDQKYEDKKDPLYGHIVQLFGQ